MFKQILAGLEVINSDVVFFCEHDVLYHPSHFDFMPSDKEIVYYNENVWHLRTTDEFALFYISKRLSQMCGERKVLIKHFKKRMEIIEELGSKDRWSRMGFEPGTHGRAERVDDYKAGEWFSEAPSIDIKDGNNATTARWKKEEFRNQKYTKGWKEGTAKDIPGWDTIAFT